MRKTFTTAALILILASLINGFLGKGAQGMTSPPSDAIPLIIQNEKGPQAFSLDPVDLSRAGNQADTKKSPPVFTLPSANPAQVPPKTTIMTTKPAPDEPTQSSPEKTKMTDKPTTVTTTAKATTVTTTTAKPTTVTTTTAKSTTVTTTTAKPTTVTTTTAKPTTVTTTTAKPTTVTTTTAEPTTKATTTAQETKTTTTSQALAGYFCYDFEAEVVRLVNIERAKEGIGPVTMNKSLRSSAAVRAVEIVDKFSHERPNGERWCTAIKVKYKCAGENLAAGQRTPERVVQAWMKSEGHRTNIMNPRYTEIGVACYHDPGQPYHYYWGQLFIGHK